MNSIKKTGSALVSDFTYVKKAVLFLAIGYGAYSIGSNAISTFILSKIKTEWERSIVNMCFWLVYQVLIFTIDYFFQKKYMLAIDERSTPAPFMKTFFSSMKIMIIQTLIAIGVAIVALFTGACICLLVNFAMKVLIGIILFLFPYIKTVITVHDKMAKYLPIDIS